MTQPLTAVPDQPAAEGAAPDALTLVMPLRAKASISLDDFYDYWLNAHVTLPVRYPGISSVWLHCVSFDRSRWPAVVGVDNRPALADEFHGVPEATFATMDGLQAFIDASSDQMDDGINFLAEEITYRSIGDATVTLVDRTGEPAPEAPDGLLRHLVFLRARAELPAGAFRDAVRDRIAPALAGAPQVRKLRRHLFEPVEVTLDHPGVVASKPLELQYQACLEVVVDDAAALDALEASDTWTEVAGALAQACAAVHGCRVDRTTTTKHDGRITLTGVRGVQVADLIRRLRADSQDAASVHAMFLPDAAPVPAV